MKTKEDAIKSFEHDKQNIVELLNVLRNLLTQKEVELSKEDRLEIIKQIKDGQELLIELNETIESLTKQ